MATHSNILAWRTPWTEGIVCNCSLVGYIQSMGLQRVRRDLAIFTLTFQVKTATH